MAKIKHIAIRTADPEKTAAFYQQLFGLKKAGLGRNGIYLTDGHINLAILKGGDKLGIEHLGFQVEDVDGTLAKLEQLGGKSLNERVNVTPRDASSPQSYYEIKCVGPDEQIIDVSGSGWVGTD
jgi:predicted enzyme related to lactoylglutathione lyase